MVDPSLAADYAALGLAPGASAEEIKQAWRRMAKATHPDLNPGDPDAARRFRLAQAAHARLTDPTRGTAGAAPRRAGPDEDWVDACAWIAEAHLLRLRVDVLPRYATRFRGGPSLVAALMGAADRGLAEAAPTEPPTAWGRAWSRGAWKRVELVVEDAPDYRGFGPVSLLHRDGRARIVLRPHVIWAEGIREEDVLRPAVRRAVDLAVVAAAPVVLGVRALEEPDRAWWVGRLFWPAVWLVVALFSVFLLAASWRAANGPERAIPERAEWKVP